MFKVGQHYSRREDIHAKFNGQRQGGISTPPAAPYIFLFTGESGEQFGYEDGWQPDQGVYLYTGEGQKGDMTFIKGNKAIRDHAINGKEILLFKALGKSKPVEFVGAFSTASWDVLRSPDQAGTMRDIIQFHLVPNDAGMTNSLDASSAVPQHRDKTKRTLKDLRAKAYAAVLPKQQKKWRSATKIVQERSATIREYILARANGVCELSGDPAPFNRKNGEPYLEVHHVLRLSDDGLDDPRNCAAITPTLHREIHFGDKGDELNKELIEKLHAIEATVD